MGGRYKNQGMSRPRSVHVPQDWDTLVRSKLGVCPAGGSKNKQGVDNEEEGSEQKDAKKQQQQQQQQQGSSSSRKRKRAAGGNNAGAASSGSGKDSKDQGNSGSSRSYDMNTTQDVCRSILRGLNRSGGPHNGSSNSNDVGESHELSLDHVLSRVPYKQMLQDLFDTGNPVAETSRVPVVSRAYEEQFMREPQTSSERQCVMGSECECNYLDRSNPFIGMEFLLPDEQRPVDVQMCVLCHRRFVQAMFHDIVFAGKQFRGVIQRYGNICGQEGEYAKEVALICPPNGPTQCMPLPAISHQRNRYSVRSIGGVRHIVQRNMSPEDFRKPPRGVH